MRSNALHLSRIFKGSQYDKGSEYQKHEKPTSATTSPLRAFLAVLRPKVFVLLAGFLLFPAFTSKEKSGSWGAMPRGATLTCVASFPYFQRVTVWQGIRISITWKANVCYHLATAFQGLLSCPSQSLRLTRRLPSLPSLHLKREVRFMRSNATRSYSDLLSPQLRSFLHLFL